MRGEPRPKRWRAQAQLRGHEATRPAGKRASAAAGGSQTELTRLVVQAPQPAESGTQDRIEEHRVAVPDLLLLGHVRVAGRLEGQVISVAIGHPEAHVRAPTGEQAGHQAGPYPTEPWAQNTDAARRPVLQSV